MKKKVLALTLMVTAAFLSGCSSNKGEATSKNGAEAAETAEATDSPYITVEPEDGKLTVAKTDLSEHATYINYDADGTQMQLIAGVASDGTYRVSLNTCQSCNPSPQAYFVEEGDKLICNNCKNQFTMDNVGASGMGCNPTTIAYEESDDAIILEESVLKDYADMFTNWEGVTA